MPPLLERHVVENDVGHRSRNAVHIPKPDGKGAAVVKLCDILNPILADVSVGAAVERDTADHTVFDILIVLEVVLVEIKLFNVLSYLKLDGARTERCWIVVFHQATLALVIRPAKYRDLRHDFDLNIVFCKLGDFHGEVLHLGVRRRCLVCLCGFRLYRVKIPRDGLLAGEAAGIESAYRINA